MTEMVFEPLFATYTLFVSGLTSIPYGKLSTLIVAYILSVLSSMTDMVFENSFATYTLPVAELTAIPMG